MATVISKIVKCTLEQYETLLKTGQVEIDGVIRYKEEGTLYLPYELDFINFYNRVKERELFRYEISHTPVAIKSLEQEYEELTTEIYENGVAVEEAKASKYVSAVGYTAILKNGDSIKVTTPNVGAFFINGERVTNDYTYTGDGYEVVNVWCFEYRDGNSLNDLYVPPMLKDTPTFIITELDVRNIAQAPVVGDGYKNYASILKAYNFAIGGLGTRKLISNGAASFNQTTTSSCIEEVESDCMIHDYNNSLINKSTLKKAIFPKLEHIRGNGLFFLNGCTNSDLIVEFPNLKIIEDTGTPNNSLIKGVVNVTLPPSVSYVGAYAFNNNQFITLQCNKATFNAKWCWEWYGSPPTNFVMCEDWQASINITFAAKNHTKDWFIDLFTDKLHDFSQKIDIGDDDFIIETREITIPLAIFNELTDEELAIAEDKNWTVGGA